MLSFVPLLCPECWQNPFTTRLIRRKGSGPKNTSCLIKMLFIDNIHNLFKPKHTLVSLRFSVSPHYIYFLSKAAHSPPPSGLGLSWRASSSSEPSFQNLPHISDQAFCLQNKLSPSRSKANVPRTPNPRQKTSPGSQLCNEHKSVRKAENTRPLSSPPCIKEGAELPDSGHSRGTRRHSRSQTSPREHKAAGYGNFPWHPDMPFTKAGELSAFATPQFWASSQRLFVPCRAEEADHPQEQRLGTAPASGWCRSPWQQTVP